MIRSMAAVVGVAEEAVMAAEVEPAEEGPVVVAPAAPVEAEPVELAVVAMAAPEAEARLAAGTAELRAAASRCRQTTTYTILTISLDRLFRHLLRARRRTSRFCISWLMALADLSS